MRHPGDSLSILQRLRGFLLLSHTGNSGRYWEIDALRGVAIVMMVVYHFAYDLTLFGYYQTNVFVGAWRIFARVTAVLFILLAGGALTLSYDRPNPLAGGWSLYRKYLRRGLTLVGWGMVITIATWAYMGKAVIIFGILHLIGTSTALAYPFLSLHWTSLVLGGLIVGVGFHVNQLAVPNAWLLPLGFRPRWLAQLDYFPLMPWFGVLLLGVFAFQLLYPGGERREELRSLGKTPRAKGLAWLGQRSLAIYLIHQPLLFGLLTLVDAVDIKRLLG